MAQQYFQSHSGVNPELISTSSAKLEDGYKKLISFWCPDRGYEWFGHNPGHEALTAYGFIEFCRYGKSSHGRSKHVCHHSRVANEAERW